MFRSHFLIYYLLLFIKGAFMGLANKVPGVSGGAVAYVLNFYEELLYSISKINIKSFYLFYKKGFRVFYRYINGSFLLTIFGGIVFSYFTISKLLDYFLIGHQLFVWSLFFGMIVGSAIYLIRKFNHWDLKSYLFLAIGLGAGFVLNFVPQGQVNYNLWFVFVCGIISVSGITIPGLSGSYILMLMGNYVFLLVDTVNLFGSVLGSILIGDLSVLYVEKNQQGLLIFFIFMLGSLMGLILFSKLLSFVFKQYQRMLDASVIGFIVGSLGTVWPWKKSIVENEIVVNYTKYWPSLEFENNLIAFVFIGLGIVIVLGIDKYSQKKEIE